MKLIRTKEYFHILENGAVPSGSIIDEPLFFQRDKDFKHMAGVCKNVIQRKEVAGGLNGKPPLGLGAISYHQSHSYQFNKKS